jgi:hypothetical protein
MATVAAAQTTRPPNIVDLGSYGGGDMRLGGCCMKVRDLLVSGLLAGALAAPCAARPRQTSIVSAPADVVGHDDLSLRDR